MAFILRRDTSIARGGQMVLLPTGTKLSDLSPDDVAQLAPDHFAEGYVDDDKGVVFTNPDARPDEWRGEEVVERDRAQAEADEADAQDRAARKAERNKATAEEG